MCRSPAIISNTSSSRGISASTCVCYLKKKSVSKVTHVEKKYNNNFKKFQMMSTWPLSHFSHTT